MGAIRLDREQLRQLHEGLAQEQQELFATCLRFSRMSKRDVLSLLWRIARLLRGHDELPEFSPMLEAQARVEGYVAEAAGVDGAVAKLEIGVLRSQIACLQWWASNGEPDTRAGFAFAVEALIEFYFGDADRHDTLLAETQLVWMASPSSPSPIASKAKRLRHKEIRQRYEDLWQEWARAHPAPATA